jgi:hypothetical protein
MVHDQIRDRRHDQQGKHQDDETRAARRAP